MDLVSLASVEKRINLWTDNFELRSLPQPLFDDSQAITVLRSYMSDVTLLLYIPVSRSFKVAR